MSAYALPGLFPPLPLENNISISSSYDSRDYEATHSDKVDFKQTVTNGPGQLCSEVEISVKEAKIDALQLIQSLTNTVLSTTMTTTTPQQSKKRGPRRNSSYMCSTDASKAEAASPQELAMQFELDVSCNGRQYTLVRSLYRIRQLREELELERCDERQEASDDSCCRRDAFFAIPELPPVQENGFYSNQSFSLLQALLRSYAPALECWLQKVVRLVSTKDSPTLTHFLLEPVCFLHSDSGGEPLFGIVSDRRPGRRMLSLESIEELHEEYHEE